MTLRYSKSKKTKKVHPFKGILLLFISILLFILTIPFGLVYGIVSKIYKKSVTGLGELSLKIAISIDQLSNVIMQDLFNKIVIKKGGYKFGNRDETISSALGKNIEMNTLTAFGWRLNKVLDFIDAGHSLSSIDYYIEPIEDNIKK